MASNTSDGGDYICTLSPELITKAEEELNEKKEWRSRDIQALRDMVKAHKGLKCPTDDAFLLKFLRARKFDYDRAYQLILNYYEVRAVNADVFKELVPSKLQHMLDNGVTTVLPEKDRHGRRIILYRPGLWDHEKYSIYDNLRNNVMAMEKVLQEETIQISGIVLIVNPAGVGMSHARAIDRNYAKLFTGVIQDAFPARLKGMYIVNEPAIMSYIFTIIKPFLKEKLASRLRFFGTDYDSLHKELGNECLPEELGGKAGPMDKLAEEWKQKMLDSETYFQAMSQYSLEVPREIIKKRNEEAVDCLVGTYKKLSVD